MRRPRPSCASRSSSSGHRFSFPGDAAQSTWTTPSCRAAGKSDDGFVEKFFPDFQDGFNPTPSLRLSPYGKRPPNPSPPARLRSSPFDPRRASRLGPPSAPPYLPLQVHRALGPKPAVSIGRRAGCRPKERVLAQAQPSDLLRPTKRTGPVRWPGNLAQLHETNNRDLTAQCACAFVGFRLPWGRPLLPTASMSTDNVASVCAEQKRIERTSRFSRGGPGPAPAQEVRLGPKAISATKRKPAELSGGIRKARRPWPPPWALIPEVNAS